MHLRKSNAGDGRYAIASSLSEIISRMNCACAEGVAARDCPLSRELFRRIECEGQSPSEAVRALGLGPRDGAYLLAGLRREVAVKLVAALLAGRTQGVADIDTLGIKKAMREE